MAKYAKLITAILGAGITAAAVLWGVDLETKGITAEGIMAMVVPLLTAFGVWAVPNKA